jgi:N-acetylneuraminate synthase
MYIVAEIGINHNGDLNTALQMIEAAKDAGADCVKFQKRNPDVCVPEHQKHKLRTFMGQEMTYLEYKKKIEFGLTDYQTIDAYCKEIGIDWTVSVFDIDSVNFMLQFKSSLPFIKVASSSITDLELFEAVNNMDLPIMMSNGMSTFTEMHMPTLLYKNIKAILHCNSSYPSNPFELDLNVISSLKALYPDLKIGYSGHEIGYKETLIAVAAGAEIIERHFTLDNNMEGTDQKASLNPVDFKNMVEEIKYITKVLGNDYMTVYPAEEIVKAKMRK